MADTMCSPVTKKKNARGPYWSKLKIPRQTLFNKRRKLEEENTQAPTSSVEPISDHHQDSDSCAMAVKDDEHDHDNMDETMIPARSTPFPEYW